MSKRLLRTVDESDIMSKVNIIDGLDAVLVLRVYSSIYGSGYYIYKVNLRKIKVVDGKTRLSFINILLLWI